jgi:acetyltransferase-like isoleucine patch superfamily enzyme
MSRLVSLEAVYERRARATLRACAAVGDEVHLRMPVVVYHPEGLRIGSGVEIGEFCVFRAHGGLVIGDRVNIAPLCVVTTRAHPTVLPRRSVNIDSPITIEDDVWIGSGATVLPGVTIGHGAIVGAGAVVTKSVEPLTIVAGIPARPIGEAEDTRER